MRATARSGGRHQPQHAVNAHARTALVEAPDTSSTPPSTPAVKASAPVPDPGHAHTPTALPRAAATRMLHVDGLRALAALAVALFHFRGYVLPLAAAMPHALDVFVEKGYMGVNVFFVLSGFVITHSLRGARVTPSFVARFALRRQLRLDPPYWIVLALAAASLSRTPGLDPVRLAPSTLAAHVVYVQNILGLPNVLDVFWTLCVEVQLYLAFVLLMGLWQLLGDTRNRRDLLLASATFASVMLCMFPMPGRIGAWFVWYWYMFALGAWARYALEERRAMGWLALFSGLALWRAYRYYGPAPVVCVATAWLLVAAARWRAISAVLSLRPLVYLGTISYSFYLLHALTGAAALRTVLEHIPPTVGGCLLAVIAALVASLLGAHALWWAVERPAMAWSRALANRGKRASLEPERAATV